MAKRAEGGRVAAMRAAREAQYAVADRAKRTARPKPLTSLTEAEAADLATLEARVREGFGAFMDVGQALAEIRDRKLYRKTHSTFEAYCRERWDIGRNWANKQIAAVGVVASLGSFLPKLPESEKVARPLAPLPVKERRKAWKRAVKAAAGKPVTAEIVKEVVREVTGAPEEELSVCPTCGRPMPRGGEHT